LKAVVYDGELRFVSGRRDPVPADGESLVRVLLAGICNTDLEITRGYMDFRGVLGHEFVGVVERSADEGLVGKRVVGEINCGCGRCPLCESGRHRHCRNRTVLGIRGRDGALAEYLTLPTTNLHVVPDSVPDDVVVFAEPVAAAFRIVENIDVRQYARWVVLGDGKLGLVAAQVLKQAGTRVVLGGRHAEKMRVARSLGIEAVPSTELACDSADAVVECTGRARGLNRALEIARPEGVVVLKSTVADSADTNLALQVIDEIMVVGSRCGPFPPALAALESGAVRVRPMITATYPLEEADTAFRKARDPESLKVLVRCARNTAP